MRLSRRLTGVLLAFALAWALAPTALAGKRTTSAPPPAVVAPTPSVPAAPTAAPDPGIVSMVDIEALR
jgi:hypothetical protein